MVRFFPERAIVWTDHELAWLRRWTLHPAGIGLATGVVIRCLNAVVMADGSSNARWTIVAVWYVIAVFVLCAVVTVHLGNYPVRQWLMRAPVFALWETAGGAVASAVLIVAHREYWGSAYAELGDWPTIVVSTLFWHMIEICLYSAMLAGVVEIARRVLLEREGGVDLPEEHDG